jgi:BirA family biotin operon repressor/biotin-[acetyl-CoA-carboxylase] ligase
MCLNVGWAPEGAAALGPVAGAVTTAQVLRTVLEELDALPADIASRYRDALVTIGQTVRVELPGGAPALHGQAVDVDDSGRLLVVDTDGVSHALDVGDVVHVRRADNESPHGEISDGESPV